MKIFLIHRYGSVIVNLRMSFRANSEDSPRIDEALIIQALTAHLSSAAANHNMTIDPNISVTGRENTDSNEFDNHKIK